MPRATTTKDAPIKVKADAAEGNATAASVIAEGKRAYRVKKELPGNTIVTVRNGFNGMLIYKSPRTNEQFVWEGFGSEQDMELQELKNARNAYKSFFANNWFLISDPEIIEYLGVGNFYANALTYENFDELYEMAPEEIGARIAKLSDGQKATVKYRAKQLIEEGVIDSIKTITALEKSLGVELIER